MNKHCNGMVSAFLGILCLGLPAVAQEAQPHKPALSFEFKTEVEPGQFSITPAEPQGSFLIEMNQAPLEPVLQALAKLANRKIIISDEAQTKLRESSKVTTFRMTPMTPDKAFAFLAGSFFSWGTFGKDTYLLVPREKSAAEIYAEKADRAKLEEKLQTPQPQEPETNPYEPQQAPMKGRLYLLPLPTFDTPHN